MTFAGFKARIWKKLSCAPLPLFEVGPYLALGFLLEAFPPLQRLMASWHGDFTFGFLGGLSVITLVLPRGRMAGLQGWMKAWGLGLFLCSFAIDGTSGFLSGYQAGRGRTSGLVILEANPWQHFFTLLLVSLILGLAFYRLAAHRQEAERQRELANMAAQAALRGKLAPHFIFNTLNTLHAQIEADPRGAQATTERLAELFRRVVEAADHPTIPLKQEMAFVEAYLGIEQARLGERLQVSIEIPEELESAAVPPLSLQVLVENAIKHGVAPLEQGGEVRIGAERQDGWLRVWVEDPGPGISTVKGTGTALDTLRQRLDRPEDLEMGLEGGRHRVGFRWRQA
jgi:two-component system sensor histidine kinase AlgZ